MPNDPVRDFKTRTDSTADTAHADIEELRRQVKELTDTFGRSVQRNMGEVEQQIREKPVQSVLVAAGIGFLFGALFA